MAIIPDFYVGDHVEVPLTFTQESGGVLPITGYVIYFTIKRSKDDLDSDAIYQTTLTITNAALGEASLIIQKTVTNAFPPGNYVYGLRVIDALGHPAVTIDSTISILKGVTNAIA